MPYRSRKRSELLYVSGNSINYDLFRVANLPWKWELAPVGGLTPRTQTIEPVFKDANQSTTIGMIKENALKNDGRNCNYQDQVVGKPGPSAKWKMIHIKDGYWMSGSHLQSLFFW